MAQGAIDGQIQHVKPKRRVKRNQDTGDELDAGAWARHDPFGWSSNVKTYDDAKPVITIGVNLAMPSDDGKAQLYPRGACVIVLSDMLEQGGHSVEIVGLHAQRQFSTTVEMLIGKISIKNADMPMDEALLSVVLCDPAFYRSMALFAATRHVSRKFALSLGKPSNTHPALSPRAR